MITYLYSLFSGGATITSALAFIEIAIQVLFAVHALKTGRNWYWLFIILFFPLVGSLVYFFVEFLPDVKHFKISPNASSGFLKLIDPDRELRFLRNNLARTDSINNRIALANACVKSGLYSEAIVLYSNSLTGVYANDPTILAGLANACFAQHDYTSAKNYLLKLRETQNNKQLNESILLLARIYEELGDFEKADNEFNFLIKRFLGEEARSRYIIFLKNNGKIEEAKNLFQTMVIETNLQPKFYRRSQKKWILLAQKALNNNK